MARKDDESTVAGHSLSPAHVPTADMAAADLVERLCRSLAFHLIESELTLSHVEGAVDDWRAECTGARALIKEAGFDIDQLYPILDRPTSGDAPQ